MSGFISQVIPLVYVFSSLINWHSVYTIYGLLLFVLAHTWKIIVWSLLRWAAKSCPWTVGGAQVIDCSAQARSWFPSPTGPELSFAPYGSLLCTTHSWHAGGYKGLLHASVCASTRLLGLIQDLPVQFQFEQWLQTPVSSSEPVMYTCKVGLGISGPFLWQQTLLSGFLFPACLTQYAHLFM